MVKLILFFYLLICNVSAFSQDSTSQKIKSKIEYAVVYKDCGSFGGYCIFYENNTTEDFLEKRNIRMPKESNVSESAKLFLAFLDYMEAMGFILITSHQVEDFQRTIKTTQYIFYRQ